MELGDFTSKLVVFGAVFLILAVAAIYFTFIKGSRREGRLKLIGVIVVLVLITLPFGWRAFVFNSKENIARRAAAEDIRRCEDVVTAYQKAQEYVTRQFSQFASLSFPPAPDGMQRVVSEGGNSEKCSLIVSGKAVVRDINGHGEIRDYSVTMYYSSGFWLLKSIKI